MAKQNKSDILVAVKPIMALSLILMWPLAMYLRSQSEAFENPEMAASIMMLNKPVPLAVTTAIFLVFALITSWPNLRETVAGLATATVALAAWFLTVAFVHNALAVMALFVLVIAMTPKVYNWILKHWSSRDTISS